MIIFTNKIPEPGEVTLDNSLHMTALTYHAELLLSH